MLSQIQKVISNLPGWRTKRKIIVIESDDWGSIRMPSVETYKFLLSKGIDLGKGSNAKYNLYDTLESADDLDELFNVLVNFKDVNGNHPIFTMLCLMANPDFDRISKEDFSQYFYEPVAKTLDRYGNSNAWTLWLSGYREKLLHPEFHGREHVNVPEWMRLLKAGDRETRLAFDQGFWGFKRKNSSAIDLQAAFDIESTNDLPVLKDIMVDGLLLFEKRFGYRASFFVPPNGPFNNSMEKAAALSGVRYMSTSKIQLEPQGLGKFKRRLHWMGHKNRAGQIYLTRNAFFEPSDEKVDWVSSCLKEVELAFYLNKPAVISTHRVNYIGSLRKINRERGLNQLKLLLKRLFMKWPDLEFMTSTELGNLIGNK